MPRQTGKSALASKLGNEGQKAFEEAKTQDTKYSGGSDLPAGIDGGIAQLVDCKFGVYQSGDFEGEFFFYAAGVVKAPAVVKIDGSEIPILGLRTQIGPEPLCDTPTRSRKTVSDHIAWVCNEFRKLGIKTAEISFDDLEDIAAGLKEAGPHFRFRTWKGEPSKDYPDPRTNHDWRGYCEYNGAADATAAVTDNTGSAAPPKKKGEEETAGEPTLLDIGEAADAGNEEMQRELTERAAANGIDAETIDTWMEVAQAVEKAEAGEAPAAEETAEDEEPEDEISWQDLGEMGDADDEEAQTKLTEIGTEYGIDGDEYELWTEFAAALVEARTAAESGESSEESSEDEWTPSVGDVLLYKPPRARSAFECEVTHVMPGSKKMNLKNLTNDTVYKAVPWDKIEQG